jgi:hypothetical protein
MFIELIDCMRGHRCNKYIHMFNYTDFIEYSESKNIKSVDDSIYYIIENDYKILFRKNKYSSKFPNVFSCTILPDRLDAIKPYINFIFAEYDGIIYRIKEIDMNTIKNDYMLENACLNSKPFSTSFKHLFLKLIKM